MIQRLLKGWWLLILCAALDAVISLLYLIQRSGNGERMFRWHGTLQLLGELTFAAGICTIGAGLWNSKSSRAWLLVLNGLACSALGSIFAFWMPRRLSFRTVALLIVAMAISLGIYELASGSKAGRPSDRWLVGAAGIVSIAFGCAFVAFAFGWMKLTPGAPTESLHWLGAYFGFSAICMLAVSLVGGREVARGPGVLRYL